MHDMSLEHFDATNTMCSIAASNTSEALWGRQQ
jgi:hypothetical protein